MVGDNDTTDAFSSMTTIDVYDIASSQWYHQERSGNEKPQVRVNPCAVVFSVPDASSFNIDMYGGQNLLPVGEGVSTLGSLSRPHVTRLGSIMCLIRYCLLQTTATNSEFP